MKVQYSSDEGKTWHEFPAIDCVIEYRLESIMNIDGGIYDKRASDPKTNELHVEMTFSGIYPIQFIGGEEYTLTLPDGTVMVFLCETMPTLTFTWLRTIK